MNYRTITIGARTQFVVKVAPEDYDFLMQWPWTYARSHGPWSGLIYARRCETIGGVKTTIEIIYLANHGRPASPGRRGG